MRKFSVSSSPPFTPNPPPPLLHLHPSISSFPSSSLVPLKRPSRTPSPHKSFISKGRGGAPGVWFEAAWVFHLVLTLTDSHSFICYSGLLWNHNSSSEGWILTPYVGDRSAGPYLWSESWAPPVEPMHIKRARVQTGRLRLLKIYRLMILLPGSMYFLTSIHIDYSSFQYFFFMLYVVFSFQQTHI